MDISAILLLFCLPMITTVPVAAWLCHYRLARKRRISYGTVFAAASGIPLLLAVMATCIEPDFWWSHEHNTPPGIWMIMLLFTAAMCLLPALCVVVYYQRRKKRDETHVL